MIVNERAGKRRETLSPSSLSHKSRPSLHRKEEEVARPPLNVVVVAVNSLSTQSSLPLRGSIWRNYWAAWRWELALTTKSSALWWVGAHSRGELGGWKKEGCERGALSECTEWRDFEVGAAVPFTESAAEQRSGAPGWATCPPWVHQRTGVKEMFWNWEEGESVWKRNRGGRRREKKQSSKFRNIVYLEAPYIASVFLNVQPHCPSLEWPVTLQCWLVYVYLCLKEGIRVPNKMCT